MGLIVLISIIVGLLAPSTAHIVPCMKWYVCPACIQFGLWHDVGLSQFKAEGRDDLVELLKEGWGGHDDIDEDLTKDLLNLGQHYLY